jgi:hypothetical protein
MPRKEVVLRRIRAVELRVAAARELLAINQDPEDAIVRVR